MLNHPSNGKVNFLVYGWTWFVFKITPVNLLVCFPWIDATLQKITNFYSNHKGSVISTQSNYKKILIIHEEKSKLLDR